MDIRKILKQLKECQDIIRFWHGYSHSEDWKIYHEQSPEMKRLNLMIKELEEYLKTIEKEQQEQKFQTAEEIVKENFHGLDSVIEDKSILKFYKGLIVTCLEGYASQFKLVRKITDEEISPRVAKLILKIRDSYIEQDFEDVWHYLYQIASPNFDKVFDNVWSEIKDIAMRDNEIR
jgi:hypothetical protein